MLTEFTVDPVIPDSSLTTTDQFCPECGRPFGGVPGHREGKSGHRAPWPEIFVAVGACLAVVFGVRSWAPGVAADGGSGVAMIVVGLLVILLGVSGVARRELAGAMMRRWRHGAALLSWWAFGEHGLAWGMFLLLAVFVPVLLTQLAAGAALSVATLDETTWRTLRMVLALVQLARSGDPGLSAGTHN